MRTTGNIRVGCALLAFLIPLPLPNPAVAASDRQELYRVLVLHSFRNSLPSNTAWYDGIVRGFTSVPDVLVQIDVEAPDLSSIDDAGYVSDLVDIYRRKYRDHKPQLIIPTYTFALRFLLEHGEELFPGTPVVFCDADRRFVAARDLAPHVTGITVRPDISGTLDLALQVHPDTRRVAVIVGSGPIDRELELEAREVLRRFEGGGEVVWLRGMPLGELTEAVRQLPKRTVILYLSQFLDRTGKPQAPVNTVRQLASLGHAPIYGLWDTLLEHGILGGRLATLEEDGFQAAQMGMRILRGAAPADLPVIDREQNDAIFHGEELARWNVEEDRLPAGSRVLHRPPSTWVTHRREITAAGLVVVVQTLLIVALLLSRARLRRARSALRSEYDRRIQAEITSVELRGRLTRFSKQRTLGTMATTIAHEINQPLIAIQNYSQAAQRRLQSGDDPNPKLEELFEKIEQQAGRAGDIILNVRTLVSSDDAELHPVHLNSLLEPVIQVVQPDAEARGCRIEWGPVPALTLPVLADAVQIQLVLVNLLYNAMQSVEDLEDKGRKVIRVGFRRTDEQYGEISVEDRGPGISPEMVEQVFEPLFSGTGDGMGMGLAICRTILDAHHGRIWCSPNPSGGAVFHFTLRRATA